MMAFISLKSQDVARPLRPMKTSHQHVSLPTGGEFWTGEKFYDLLPHKWQILKEHFCSKD